MPREWVIDRSIAAIGAIQPPIKEAGIAQISRHAALEVPHMKQQVSHLVQLRLCTGSKPRKIDTNSLARELP